MDNKITNIGQIIGGILGSSFQYFIITSYFKDWSIFSVLAIVLVAGIIWSIAGRLIGRYLDRKETKKLLVEKGIM